MAILLGNLRMFNTSVLFIVYSTPSIGGVAVFDPKARTNLSAEISVSLTLIVCLDVNWASPLIKSIPRSFKPFSLSSSKALMILSFRS
ncbi:hypothetical protein E3U55_09065 [Filobacillus milosensis]|uniref:Uncharacterized protein n=1 Tax=Filobacillus milosensis TaxID=94137 RepID=A0A4Y8IMM5_9BACI|nr:hypothetical protein E3U55_09065 [Filobacillus milosensis]